MYRSSFWDQFENEAMNTVKKASKTKGFSNGRHGRKMSEAVLCSKALKRLPRLMFRDAGLVEIGQISAFHGRNGCIRLT